VSLFGNEIISWYELCARELPWRKTKDPYPIWLSEIILQQTRVAQGLPYYNKFISHFPTLKQLAESSESKLLTLWQGLGYYSRARNMHKCAQTIMNEYGGVFPKTYNGLIALPGIGPYTAAAIASFAFQEKVAVVDGNVIRLVSRYLGLTTPVNEKLAAQQINDFVQKEVLHVKPDLFNQSMMEMGSLICSPRNPKCDTCVLAINCEALKTDKVNEIPKKSSKIKVTQKYFNYYLKEENRRIALVQRQGKGIWQNLHEFPMHESTVSQDEKGAELIAQFTHILSHQRIEAKLWKVNKIPSVILQNNSIFEVALDEIGNIYPVHQLMNKMIQAWQEQ